MNVSIARQSPCGAGALARVPMPKPARVRNRLCVETQECRESIERDHPKNGFERVAAEIGLSAITFRAKFGPAQAGREC